MFSFQIGKGMWLMPCCTPVKFPWRLLVYSGSVLRALPHCKCPYVSIYSFYIYVVWLLPFKTFWRVWNLSNVANLTSAVRENWTFWENSFNVWSKAVAHQPNNSVRKLCTSIWVRPHQPRLDSKILCWFWVYKSSQLAPRRNQTNAKLRNQTQWSVISPAWLIPETHNCFEKCNCFSLLQRQDIQVIVWIQKDEKLTNQFGQVPFG